MGIVDRIRQSDICEWRTSAKEIPRALFFVIFDHAPKLVGHADGDVLVCLHMPVVPFLWLPATEEDLEEWVAIDHSRLRVRRPDVWKHFYAQV